MSNDKITLKIYFFNSYTDKLFSNIYIYGDFMSKASYESLKDTSGSIFAEKQNEYPVSLHFHRAFEIAYILEGVSHYTIEGEEFEARPGDIVFAHCCYRHRSLPTPTHTKYVVAVPENITSDISKLFKNNTLPPLLNDKEFNKTLLPYFEALVNGKNNMLKILAKGYSNIIFGSLAAHYEKTEIKQKNKNVSIIEDILNFIDEHYCEPITLESISKEFGYNKTYFSRLFNGHIGMTLNNYINMVRYDKFDSMIKNPENSTVTELIFKCGFPSLSTFYRIRKYHETQKSDL